MKVGWHGRAIAASLHGALHEAARMVCQERCRVHMAIGRQLRSGEAIDHGKGLKDHGDRFAVKACQKAVAEGYDPSANRAHFLDGRFFFGVIHC